MNNKNEPEKLIKFILACNILLLIVVIFLGVSLFSQAQASEVEPSNPIAVLEVEDFPEPEPVPVVEEPPPEPEPEPEPVVIQPDPTVVQIQNHLGDRPLAQYAETIAQACSVTGMDPYWFCTISIVESGGGANCFLPCNAWGYGNYAWSSWEEAIHSFASMFVNGYGSGLTAASHLTYCPGGAYYEYV